MYQCNYFLPCNIGYIGWPIAKTIPIDRHQLQLPGVKLIKHAEKLSLSNCLFNFQIEKPDNFSFANRIRLKEKKKRRVVTTSTRQSRHLFIESVFYIVINQELYQIIIICLKEIIYKLQLALFVISNLIYHIESSQKWIIPKILKSFLFILFFVLFLF